VLEETRGPAAIDWSRAEGGTIDDEDAVDEAGWDESE
jgi:hypothetical protein